MKQPVRLPGNTRAFAPICLAVVALVAESAQAQTATTPAQRVEVTASAIPRLDERATSTSRLGMSVRETPASISVIDQKTIEEMGALNTQDILGAIPGVSWSAQPGSAGSVFYRGFGVASLTQLWNGLSVQYDAIAARPVDSWIVAGAEAIGGPSSFLYGSGGVGGTINLITKVADGSGDLTHLRGAVGTTNQLAADVQRKLGDGGAHALRLLANVTDGTHWSSGEARKAWQASASWHWAITPQLTHLLATEQQWEQVRQPYWGTPLLRNSGSAILGQIRTDPGTIGVNYNVRDGRYEQTLNWTRSVLKWTPSAQLAFTHTAYAYDAQRDFGNVEVYSFVNNNTQVERSSALLQRHDQQVFGSRGELSVKGSVGGLKSDSAFGWDWNYNRQTRFPLSVAGPFGRTDPYKPADSFFLSTPGITRTYTPGATNRLHTLAAFAENRTVLGNGWSVIGGLRVDRITLRVTNHRTVTGTNPALFSIAYRPVTGRLGVVKELNAQWQVYGQYSTAADPPAGILSTAGFSALRDFDLTKGRQFEVGTKGVFDGGRGDLRVALYDIVRENISVTDPNDRTRVIPIGAQSARGIEVVGGWALTPAINLSGHISYTDAQFKDFTETVGTTVVQRAGKRPANTPDWVAGAAVHWKPVAGWQVAVDWRHVGQRHANTANTAWDGAYDLFGAQAAWQWDARTTVRARVNNLTDKVYAATVGASNLAYLGTPRTWTLSADWRF